jgi:hypothetical protein
MERADVDFRIEPAQEAQVIYRVTVETGAASGSGTSANVSVEMAGQPTGVIGTRRTGKRQVTAGALKGPGVKSLKVTGNTEAHTTPCTY